MKEKEIKNSPDSHNTDYQYRPIDIKLRNLLTFSSTAYEEFLINIYDAPNRPLLIREETADST